MSVFRDFFTDPVLFLSFGGLVFILVMMGYLSYMFISKSSDDEGHQN